MEILSKPSRTTTRNPLGVPRHFGRREKYGITKMKKSGSNNARHDECKWLVKALTSWEAEVEHASRHFL